MPLCKLCFNPETEDYETGHAKGIGRHFDVVVPVVFRDQPTEWVTIRLVLPHGGYPDNVAYSFGRQLKWAGVVKVDLDKAERHNAGTISQPWENAAYYAKAIITHYPGLIVAASD